MSPHGHGADAALVESPEDKGQPLTRGDWLDYALKTLVDDGIDRVRIQTMAKQLGVARSSFYWHFNSSAALHQAMLDEWLRKNTGPIIERSMRPAPDANRAIINVFECWVDTSAFDPNLDIAVRLWARRSPKVRKVVLDADRMRVDALRRMFLRYDYGEEEALIRARVIYYTQIGQYTLDDFEDPATRFSRGPTYINIFSGQAISREHQRAFLESIEDNYRGDVKAATKAIAKG